MPGNYFVGPFLFSCNCNSYCLNEVKDSEKSAWGTKILQPGHETSGDFNDLRWNWIIISDIYTAK